ncbi:hypothetical protein DSO57_1015256 [Entomophthora muscae]|uniref:Uncharacterized protein n=1 Tax=Entomophthora muscae TaxID=34485 RepID=A0ACC2T560_9FUNG|nr:hypothetical protein DSO57_1015256 [Entomophthora muscae]
MRGLYSRIGFDDVAVVSGLASAKQADESVSALGSGAGRQLEGVLGPQLVEGLEEFAVGLQLLGHLVPKAWLEGGRGAVAVSTPGGVENLPLNMASVPSSLGGHVSVVLGVVDGMVGSSIDLVDAEAGVVAVKGCHAGSNKGVGNGGGG